MKRSSGLSEIGEFGLIRALADRLPKAGTDVSVGIGDDAAAVDPGSGRLLLATCDIQIEDIHFTRRTFSPEEIGAKAAAVNLSDIAAMGGRARFALVSIAVPADLDAVYMEGIYDGLGRMLARYGAVVIGGNTSDSPGGLIVDMTLLGDVEPCGILTRSGASPGDRVCVTGDLGASRAGLKLLLGSDATVAESVRTAVCARHRVPTPRLREGEILAACGATACLDVSDGLAGDAQRLSEKSGVRVELRLDWVPVSAATESVACALGDNPALFALAGGEDFELLFTAPPDRVADISSRVRAATGTNVSVIGEICEGEGVWVAAPNDGPFERIDAGFDHFK